MWATDQPAAPRKRARPAAQGGATAVEFALVAVLFLTIVFGILELARIMYMYNTFAEATRSAAAAAANIDFTNTTEVDAARRRAVFDETSGKLLFGEPVTYKNVRVDYLYLDRTSGKLLPVTSGALSCPARVRQNCLTDQYGSTCVRAVRVQMCTEAGSGTCTPIKYQGLLPFVNFNVNLPISTTIVKAETLGYVPGDAVCE
jgi:Flp pilus assembly protein TadG